jgi:ATP-binding cassette subfamily B multidrug efflux pump
MITTKTLLGYFRPHRSKLIFGIVCVLMVNAIKLTAPIVLGRAVDDLTGGASRDKLLLFGGLLVLITLVQGVFLFLQRLLFIHISRHADYHLRDDFYAHLQALPYQCYQGQHTGDLMARATNDISVIRNLVGAGLMYFLNTAFIILLIVPQMALVNWRLTLVAFIWTPLVALANQGFSKRIHNRSKHAQEAFGIVSNQAQESLSGIRLTRAYMQEDAEIRKFRGSNRELVNHNLKLVRLTAVFAPVLQFLAETGFLVLLWFGGSLVTNKQITIGQFVQFTLYLGYLIYPMIELGSVVSLFQRGKASLGRINEIMSIKPAGHDTEPLTGITQIDGEIEFRDLTFAYSDSVQPAIADINLRIRPGQTVAFVGSVGSGKSTLMNVVPRLLETQHGQVLIDGHPIQKVPLSVLRKSIACVPQESFLFSGTLSDNIAFGAKDATVQEIEQAAAEAELSNDIEGFSEGYQTILGERGVTLSGGQKQRTALARALIRKPRILILDDAMSSVDAFTEERILDHLRQIMRDRTTLIISQRISTVMGADQIVVLDGGRIIECGTHQELLLLGGLYADLYTRQHLEQELKQAI